jgi:dipeptidase E
MSERKIILTSNGIRGLEDQVIKLLGQKPKGLKAAYIPTVVDDPRKNLGANRSKQNLLDMGMEVSNFYLSHQEPYPLRKALEKKDLVMINGGDPYKLLGMMRRCKLDTTLNHLLDLGIVCITISASSLIMGPSIEPIAGSHLQATPNKERLKNFQGFRFFPDAIWPHFVNRHQEIISRLSLQVPYKITPLKDGQAIVIRGEKTELVEVPRQDTPQEKIVKDKTDLSLKELKKAVTSIQKVISELNNPHSMTEVKRFDFEKKVIESGDDLAAIRTKIKSWNLLLSWGCRTLQNLGESDNPQMVRNALLAPLKGWHQLSEEYNLS